MDITERLNDKAIRWKNPRPDGYGKFVYDPPEEIDCWWEWRQEWFRDDSRTESLSNAVILTNMAIQGGERLKKGTLPADSSGVDSSSGAGPSPYDDDVWEVRLSEEEKTVGGKTVIYKVTV